MSRECSPTPDEEFDSQSQTSAANNDIMPKPLSVSTHTSQAIRHLHGIQSAPGSPQGELCTCHTYESCMTFTYHDAVETI